MHDVSTNSGLWTKCHACATWYSYEIIGGWKVKEKQLTLVYLVMAVETEVVFVVAMVVMELAVEIWMM